MLNFYHHSTITYRNGKKIKTQYCGRCLTETQPEDYTEELTWENLIEKHSVHGIEYPFSIWKFKRGFRVSFFDTFQKDIKQWKEPLNLSIEHKYTLYTPSIDEVLKFPDGEKAIRYLVERGISIVGK